MKFGVYEVSKPILKNLMASLFANNSEINTDPAAFLMASIFAGAVAALLLCPMESLRIKQVTDESYQNDSLLTGLPKLIQQDGVASLFAGILAMLSKQVRCKCREGKKHTKPHQLVEESDSRIVSVLLCSTHLFFFISNCLSGV